MPKQREPRWLPVSIELNGKTYDGSYSVSGGMITVSGPYGSRRTQVGGSPPDMLARMLLAEIVHQNKDE